MRFFSVAAYKKAFEEELADENHESIEPEMEVLDDVGIKQMFEGVKFKNGTQLFKLFRFRMHASLMYI